MKMKKQIRETGCENRQVPGRIGFLVGRTSGNINEFALCFLELDSKASQNPLSIIFARRCVGCAAESLARPLVERRKDSLREDEEIQ